MNTTKESYLSFYNDQGILTLNAKQFDTGRIFVFDIMDNNEPFDLTGCTVSLHIQKADGTQFQGEDCCTAEGSKITINPALGNGAQILAADGINTCELVLKNSKGLTLTTWDFHINVLKRVHNGENLKSSDAYDVLDKIDKEEKVRKANEAARIEAETIRGENEGTRQTSETLRISAENTRNAQEKKRQEDTAKAIADAEKATQECIELNHTAAESAKEAENWANQSKDYAKSWKGSLLPRGIIHFSQLPTNGMISGYLYHIEDAFVTDARFKEGVGYSYPAGTNVYWTQDEKWDCLSGVLTKELTKAEYSALSEAEKMNGTIYYISDADNTVGEATSTEKGLVKVDTALSESSANPVQNKIITSGLNDTKRLITELTARLNALADSDDTTLDQLSEIVAYIKSNRGLIESVTTSKVNVSDIIDGLTSTASNKPLSANQGKVLNDLIAALTATVGNKVNKVSGKGLSTNDYTTAEKNKLGGIASGAEVNVQADWNVTDSNSDAYIKNKPAIPSVGNGVLTIQKNGTNVQTFTANQSANATANIIVPTKTSELKNDSGFVTAGSITTGVSGVKGNAENSYRTGNVNLTAANIGALAVNGTATNASKLNGYSTGKHNAIPVIGNNGILEISNFIDFHDGATDNSDFSMRIEAWNTGTGGHEATFKSRLTEGNLGIRCEGHYFGLTSNNGWVCFNDKNLGRNFFKGTADKAIEDGNGYNIANTYVRKDNVTEITTYASEAPFNYLNGISYPAFINQTPSKISYYCLRFSNGIQILGMSVGEYQPRYSIIYPYAFINTAYILVVSNEGQDSSTTLSNGIQIVSKEPHKVILNISKAMAGNNLYSEYPNWISLIMIGRWK